MLALSCLMTPAQAADVAAREVSPSELKDYWRSEGPIKLKFLPMAGMLNLQACYVAAYTIAEDGVPRDVEIVREDVSFGRGGASLGRRQRAHAERELAQAQQAEVVAAVARMRFVPAVDGAAVAVRTRTVPLVIASLTLEQPDDPVAAARAREAHEKRREELFRKCAGAAPGG